MYLRTTARRNKDGLDRALSRTRAQPAGRHGDEGERAAQLGREDRLDPDGLRRLVRSINRHLGERDAGSDAAAATGTDTGRGVRLVASRPAGAPWLLDGAWKALGVDAALRAVLGGRRFTTDVERVLFALMATLDPSSKLAAADRASRDVVIPVLRSSG